MTGGSEGMGSGVFTIRQGSASATVDSKGHAVGTPLLCRYVEAVMGSTVGVTPVGPFVEVAPGDPWAVAEAVSRLSGRSTVAFVGGEPVGRPVVPPVPEGAVS